MCNPCKLIYEPTTKCSLCHGLVCFANMQVDLSSNFTSERFFVAFNCKCVTYFYPITVREITNYFLLFWKKLLLKWAYGFCLR